MDIGKSIKIARTMNEMSTADLAKELGCTAQHVRDMEKSGNKMIKKLLAVADALGFDLDCDVRMAAFTKLGERK